MRNVKKEMLLLIQEETGCDIKVAEQIYKQARSEFLISKGLLDRYVHSHINEYLANQQPT